MLNKNCNEKAWLTIDVNNILFGYTREKNVLLEITSYNVPRKMWKSQVYSKSTKLEKIT